jgi:hypothetical protein
LYRLTVAGFVTADGISRRGRANEVSENLVAEEVGASATFVLGERPRLVYPAAPAELEGAAVRA